MTLVALLAQHPAADAKEQADLEAMRRFAAELPSPFARTQWPAHFTGSAVVASADGRAVCLVHHAKLHRWLQPGGHAELGDGGDILATCLREAQEETGLVVRPWPGAPVPFDVDVHVIPARKDEPEHRHLDVRVLFACDDPSALRHDPNESFGAQWVPWADAVARADEPALKRLLEKARALAAK